MTPALSSRSTTYRRASPRTGSVSISFQVARSGSSTPPRPSLPVRSGDRRSSGTLQHRRAVSDPRGCRGTTREDAFGPGRRDPPVRAFRSASLQRDEDAVAQLGLDGLGEMALTVRVLDEEDLAGADP